jgi:hypothetical protein
MSSHQTVMMKIFKVEEGVKEMVVDKKYKVRGENGKTQQQSGPSSGPLKLIPSIEDVTIESKSEDHMVLPYSPYMKHIHPRAIPNQTCFLVDGSFLTYLPSPSEFTSDLVSPVEYDHDSCHRLFFKRDVDFTDSNVSLWFCTSLQSSKNDPILRCEQVGTGIIEEIPLGNLAYAIRTHDEKAIAPYIVSTPTSLSMPSQSGPGIKKMQNKKHGKVDAALDQDHIHTSSSISRS